jgi:ferredoxin-type protein NapF
LTEARLVDITKRHFFRRNHESDLGQRLPWLDSKSLFTDGCTRCGKCVTACETNIIVLADGGFPQVDFNLGECTFCRQCADVCPEPLFLSVTEKPWQQVAVIGETCLAFQGIECRSCGDTCDYAAIKFRLQVGGSATPQLSQQDCTGCGACIKPCPSDAIQIKTGSDNELPR